MEGIKYVGYGLGLSTVFSLISSSFVYHAVSGGDNPYHLLKHVVLEKITPYFTATVDQKAAQAAGVAAFGVFISTLGIYFAFVKPRADEQYPKTERKQITKRIGEFQKKVPKLHDDFEMLEKPVNVDESKLERLIKKIEESGMPENYKAQLLDNINEAKKERLKKLEKELEKYKF